MHKNLFKFLLCLAFVLTSNFPTLSGEPQDEGNSRSVYKRSIDKEDGVGSNLIVATTGEGEESENSSSSDSDSDSGSYSDSDSDSDSEEDSSSRRKREAIDGQHQREKRSPCIIVVSGNATNSATQPPTNTTVGRRRRSVAGNILEISRKTKGYGKGSKSKHGRRR